MIQLPNDQDIPVADRIPDESQAALPARNQQRIALVGLAVVTSLTVVLGLVLFMVVRANRTAVHPIALDLPVRVLPGSLIPRDANCDWSMVTEYRLFCHVNNDGVPIHFNYDMRRGVVISVSVETGEITVGELILAWGEPTGYTKSGTAVQLYWGVRSVYLMSRVFTPSARAGYVFYTREPNRSQPWRGFVTQ
jgi:hypothetical protein